MTPAFSQNQEKVGEPTNEKAQKSYKGAMQLLEEHQTIAALGEFKKADKQDDGKCLACQRKMIKYGVDLEDWKTAELGAQEMVAEAQGPRDTAIAHYELAVLCATEGMRKHKDEFFPRAHEEAAKARFEEYVKMKPADDPVRKRAALRQPSRIGTRPPRACLRRHHP